MMQFDLVIVGGGLVGASLALALRDSGLRIALIDARLPTANDHRLIALNASNISLLNKIGIWRELATHATAIQQVHVSSKGHFGAVRLRAEEVDLPQLGFVIPAHYIEAALNKQLAQQDAITNYRPALLQKINMSDAQAHLLVKRGDSEIHIQASFIIGADGTESTVRKQLGMSVDVHDYDQAAIVTRTFLQRSHQSIAYERFTATGAMAMLPLTGNECATIWTVNNAQLPFLMNLSDQEFLQTLQENFGYRLGRFQRVTERFTYPLRMVRAKVSCGEFILLLGNAAHTIHPIAAQGLNMALYEIAVLAEKINELAKEGRKVNLALLQPTINAMQQESNRSIDISHRLATLFHQPMWITDFMLPAGLIGFDLLLPAKKRFLQALMKTR